MGNIRSAHEDEEPRKNTSLFWKKTWSSGYEPGKFVWQPDNATKLCVRCGQDFTLFIRRHHCRSCGHIVCAFCSSRQAQRTSNLPLLRVPSAIDLHGDEPVRTCDGCIMMVDKLVEARLEEKCDDSDDEEAACIDDESSKQLLWLVLNEDLQAKQHKDQEKEITSLLWSAEINYADESGITPLLGAALNEEGDPGTVVNLLRHGANVHYQNAEGHTALHFAAALGRTEVVKILLDWGSHLHFQNKRGFFPGQMSFDGGCVPFPEIVNTLVDSGSTLLKRSYPSRKLTNASTHDFSELMGESKADLDEIQQRTLAKVEKQIDIALERQKTAYLRKLAVHEKRSESQTKDIEKLRRENEHLSQENTHQTEKLQKMFDKAQQSAPKKFQSPDRRTKQLEKELRIQKSKLKVQQQQAVDTEKALKEQVADAQKEIEELESKHVDYESMLSAQGKDLTDQKHARHQAEANVTLQKEKYSNLKREFEDLNNSTKDIREKYERLKKELGEMRKGYDELEEQHLHLTNQHQKLQEDFTGLKVTKSLPNNVHDEVDVALSTETISSSDESEVMKKKSRHGMDMSKIFAEKGKKSSEAVVSHSAPSTIKRAKTVRARSLFHRMMTKKTKKYHSQKDVPPVMRRDRTQSVVVRGSAANIGASLARMCTSRPTSPPANITPKVAHILSKLSIRDVDTGDRDQMGINRKFEFEYDYDEDEEDGEHREEGVEDEEKVNGVVVEEKQDNQKHGETNRENRFVTPALETFYPVQGTFGSRHFIDIERQTSPKPINQGSAKAQRLKERRLNAQKYAFEH